MTPSFAGGQGLLLSLCGLLGPLSLCLKRRRHISWADGRWEVGGAQVAQPGAWRDGRRILIPPQAGDCLLIRLGRVWGWKASEESSQAFPGMEKSL